MSVLSSSFTSLFFIYSLLLSHISLHVYSEETTTYINGEANEPSIQPTPNKTPVIINHPTGSYLACSTDKGYKYKENPSFFGADSPLAHRLLDGMCGIEIGPSACNPFNLNTIEVGLTAETNLTEFTYYSNLQLNECGDYAKVDYGINDAADLSIFATSSTDFVLHSHVWEHLPNPLRALEEWVRVTKHGGIIFVIVPHPCASPLDCGRPPTTIHDLLDYYHANANMSSFDFPDRYVKYNGHLHVFNHELLLEIMFWFNQQYSESANVSLILGYFMLQDDKLYNGYLISWVVNKVEERELSDVYYGRFCHPKCKQLN